MRADDEHDTEPLNVAIAFDDTGVVSVDVGHDDTDLVHVNRAVTAEEWPPEPPRPATGTPRRARFYPVVQRPKTCGDAT